MLVELLESLVGSLIEIYVLAADRSVWARAIGALAGRADSIEIVVDGRQLDASAVDEVRFDDESTRVLRAFVNGAEWTSTLYREDQVDFQMAPEDFTDTESVVRLLDTLQQIADATRRAALLMAETVDPEAARPLATAEPNTGI